MITAKQKNGVQQNSPVFLIVALLLIYIMAARTPLDPDLWWHLRAGEETIRTGFPMTADTLSFTRMGSAWTNHSWLAQVILYGVHSGLGYTGLAVFMALCAVLSMALTAGRMAGSNLIKMFLLVLGGIAASVNWVPRPQIISLVLLALTGVILDGYLRKPSRRIWIFPVVMMVWGNLHGGYPLGLLLAGCAAGGAILARLCSQNGGLSWKAILRLIAAMAAGYLLTAVNPNGLNTLLIPFQTVNMAGLQNLISEWASPDFHDPLTQVFLVYCLVILWVLAFTRKRAGVTQLLTITVFGIMAFTARRNFGPFVLVSLPILADWLEAVTLPEKIRLWMERLRNKARTERNLSPAFQKTVNTMLVILLLLAALIKTLAVTEADFMQEMAAQNYPAQAAEWMRQHVTPTRLLNEYDWGGYLVWQMREYPVFVDGRTDLFGDEILNAWLDLMQCESGTDQELNSRDIHLILIKPDRPLAHCLLDDGWQIVYKDDQAVILTDGLKLLH